MLLTTLLDPIPIFPIRLKYFTGSIYVANVTTYTTGEVLLKNFQNCVGEYANVACKLVYHDKDIQLSDTLEGLGIKVNVYKCFMRLPDCYDRVNYFYVIFY
jgi:hypothetical protein